MNLLSARATATSYPTDNALIRRFIVPGVSPNDLVPAKFILSASSSSVSLGTTPVASADLSIDNGATWVPVGVSCDATEMSAVVGLPNGCKLRPTFTTGGGTPSVNFAVLP